MIVKNKYLVMKYYTVAFRQGLGGSFVISLISQHNGFYPIHYRTEKFCYTGDDNKDYKHIALSEKDYTKETLHEFKSEYDKFIFKPMPHSYAWFEENTFEQDVNVIAIVGEIRTQNRYIHNDIDDYQMYRMQKNYKNIHFLDIKKLLDCDETEYKSLLKFIDCEENKHWKDMINGYKIRYL